MDEQHDVDDVLERQDLPSGEVRVKIRLSFSLRKPPDDEFFTGTAFHTWLLRNDGGRLRVAAQIVDGFADLNDNAKRLFATPDQGLNRGSNPVPPRGGPQSSSDRGHERTDGNFPRHAATSAAGRRCPPKPHMAERATARRAHHFLVS